MNLFNRFVIDTKREILYKITCFQSFEMLWAWRVVPTQIVVICAKILKNIPLEEIFVKEQIFICAVGVNFQHLIDFISLHNVFLISNLLLCQNVFLLLHDICIFICPFDIYIFFAYLTIFAQWTILRTAKNVFFGQILYFQNNNIQQSL